MSAVRLNIGYIGLLHFSCPHLFLLSGISNPAYRTAEKFTFSPFHQFLTAKEAVFRCYANGLGLCNLSQYHYRDLTAWLTAAWKPPRLTAVSRGLHVIRFFCQNFITLLAIPFVDALFFHRQVCHVGITPEIPAMGAGAVGGTAPAVGNISSPVRTPGIPIDCLFSNLITI